MTATPGTALALRSSTGPVQTADAGSAMADLLETWHAGKHPGTVRAYTRDLESFRAWAGHVTAAAALEWFVTLPQGAANANALRYRGALQDAGLAPATINRRLSALRSAVQLARLVGRITWTLETASVEAVKYRDTRGPGVPAVRTMIASLANRTDARSCRDLALVRLLFDMGLRRAEVTSLDVAHYDRTAGTLSVLGKKRLSRELLTVPAPTRVVLEAWIAARGDAPGALFLSCDRGSKARTSARLTGRSVARIVGAVGADAGVGVVRPHGLRHSAITHALDATAGDVRRVQKFSRHRDMRTLAIYDDARTDMAGEVAALVANIA